MVLLYWGIGLCVAMAFHGATFFLMVVTPIVLTFHIYSQYFGSKSLAFFLSFMLILTAFTQISFAKKIYYDSFWTFSLFKPQLVDY